MATYLTTHEPTAPAPRKDLHLRIALVGNPNCGKTSLFNALTGGRQRVGNYPGVTVERRVGRALHRARSFEILDLPGTYSLTSFTPEERITQREMLGRGYDVAVVVADSMTLDRGLVIAAQVLQLHVRAVLCLNMADEARRAGLEIDLPLMRRLLGVPVVATVGNRGEGTAALLDAISEAASGPEPALDRVVLGQRLGTAIDAVRSHLGPAGPHAGSGGFVAMKLLLGEADVVASMREAGPGGALAVAEAEHQRERLEAETGMDAELFVAERYSGFVAGLLREAIRTPPRADARVLSDRIDRVLADPRLGLPAFAAVMYGIFWLTFAAGEVPMGWIEAAFAWLTGAVSGAWPDEAAPLTRSLVIDGILGGVGGVLVFLPNIALLFLGLAFLEDSGYMARAAFLMDNVMHRVSLHGRSFLPLLTGFGCSIPGIMATRTIENERDRLATMMVLPLMSCGARLPIWMLLVPAFFAPAWRAPALFGIYLTGIVLALCIALLLRRTLLRGEEAPFVMELPPYRLPTLRALASRMADRSWQYLRKAGTIILGISILMWLLVTFPEVGHFAVDDDIASGRVRVVAAGPDTTEAGAEHSDVESLTEAEAEARRTAERLQGSFAGRIGRALEPVVSPLGFDWRIATALLGAFAAKEVFVAQMGVVYSVGEAEDEAGGGERGARRAPPG